MSNPSASSVADTPQSDRIARAVFEHAARISRVQDVTELIRLNADFARDLVGADRCSLWLVDERSNELWTMVAHGSDTIRIPLHTGLVGVCVDDGERVLVNDLSTEPRFFRRVDANSGYHTEQVLCIPLRSERGVIGALQLLNKAGGFTEADMELMGLLAHFAASAIESDYLRRRAAAAQLMLHELNLARDVQARLMPQEIPVTAGLECVGFCRPARTIGGDYYDLLNLDDGRFAFTLGDVSGKGIPAAVMMASIQTLLRSLLQYEHRDLAAAVSELNRTLYASSPPERYSTLFCGVMNQDRTLLTYVNAGHIPPLLLRGDGELTSLPGGGLPVGLLPFATYEQFTVTLDGSDLIVAVSDGIIEARNPEGDFWDEMRVQEIVRESGSGPIAVLAEVLTANIDSFAAGADQYDDMTIVVVRRI
jgi:sigma-B regulation protein RsbU (phosphoserine phosphatase)